MIDISASPSSMVKWTENPLTMDDSTFLELERQFIDFSRGPTGLHAEFHLQIAAGLNQGVGWNDLLQNRWVVILGEAGTGKTTEFQHRTTLLRRQNYATFFMNITALAQDGPELAVRPDETRLLEEWKSGDKEAIFFLDSVDEAKLRQEALARALRKLAHYAVSALSRLRLVVSCRVSDWHTDSDRGAILSYVHTAGGTPDDVKIVQIMPLSDTQVHRLAQHWGVDEPEALLTAVREASVQPFIARPLDVEWLVGYWKDNQSIGSLTELVEGSVTRRLRELRVNSGLSSTLDPRRAREGLMQLAGVAVLSGRWSFLLPGEPATGVGREDTLDPREVLDDWNDLEIRELLTRAVFDESTYGRVRFHHRTVQEYLAAQWLLNKRRNGMRQRELAHLLFRTLGSRVFVPSHLLATAAWIASENQNVLDRLIELSPEALFELADPASLRLKARERALSSYLGRYKARQRLYDHFDSAALRRFAPAMERAVKTSLNRSDLPDEAVAFLLNLATSGRFESCCEESLKWAAQPEADSNLQCAAFEAVNLLATNDQKYKLAEHRLKSSNAWEQDAAGVFAHEFFPQIIGATGLGRILENVIPLPPNHSSVLKSFCTVHLPRLCPPQQRLSMLTVLLGAFQRTAQDGGWLLDGLQGMSIVVIDSLSVDEEPPAELQGALQALREHVNLPWDGTINRPDLCASIARRPRIRRWLFWVRAREVCARLDKWPSSPFELYEEHPLMQVASEDSEWLTRDALAQEDEGARLLAFVTLWHLERGAPHLSKNLSTIADEGDSAFKQFLTAQTARLTTPRQPEPWEIEMQHKREARKQLDAENRAKSLETLAANLDKIRAGDAFPLLHWLFQKARTGASSYAVSIDRIRDEFGDEIAEATSTGLRTFWRNYKPDFGFERGNRNLVTHGTRVGLAGLQLDFAQGLEPESLSEDELDTVVRYAVHELNGLPPWFLRLATSRPREVATILRPVLEADLQITSSSESSEVLRRHRQLPTELSQHLATLALMALERETPVLTDVLDDALQLCTWANPSARKQLIDLCVMHLEASASTDQSAIWWRELAKLDPLGAVCHLEEFVEGGTQTDVDALMESICSRLTSMPGEAQQTSALMVDAEALERLIPMVYAAIRPEADEEDFSGEAQFVDARDNAERFRGQLFGALAAIGTPEAFVALQRLARDPRLAAFRNILLHHAHRSPQASVEAQPMSPNEAMLWARTHTMPIRNAHDLYRVTMDRVDDIRGYVEEGEFSNRATYVAGNESAFQNLLAEELQRRDVHGCEVFREPEVDREKKPDIRLSHSACAGHPVSIEIKVAENWTFLELQAALHAQLVGQYLRADKSRHGILLLCSRPPEKSKRPKSQRRTGKVARKTWDIGGQQVDFKTVLAELQQQADELVARHSYIDALDVMGIDFY